MKLEDSHLSDELLLCDVDGELSAGDRKRVRSHLETCWKCRARRQELDASIAGFVRAHRQEFGAGAAPVAGPRALLKARLAQLSEARSDRDSKWTHLRYRLAAALAIGALLAIVLLAGHSRVERRTAAVFSLPDSTLTPGATILVDRQQVCTQPGPNNKAVPVALRTKVLEEYRIVGADPRAYEIDYLVTPALGGADDIRNLWPHSYSATVWNAEVKDALEGRLRQMVCEGDLDLSEAQREIATNWIAAYKKYFRTDEPLADPPR